MSKLKITLATVLFVATAQNFAMDLVDDTQYSVRDPEKEKAYLKQLSEKNDRAKKSFKRARKEGFFKGRTPEQLQAMSELASDRGDQNTAWYVHKLGVQESLAQERQNRDQPPAARRTLNFRRPAAREASDSEQE